MTTYVGGKKTIGKEIALMLLQLDGGRALPYWEPFVGMCGVMRHIPDDRPRFGSDLNSEVIAMWQQLQRGWIPPMQCSEAEYLAVKNNSRAPPHLRAFLGHGYSYCGAYFAAYKPKFSTYDQGAGRRAFEGVMNVLQDVSDVTFFAAPYDQVSLPNESKTPMLIYCDPPYAGSASKVGRTKSSDFDHASFWNWVRHQSKQHIVAVSETVAPPDFIPIWTKSRHVKVALRNKDQQHIQEALFVHKSVLAKLH